MTFGDEAAREHHTGTDHVTRLVDVVYPLCVEPPEFRDIRAVASYTGPETS